VHGRPGRPEGKENLAHDLRHRRKPVFPLEILEDPVVFVCHHKDIFLLFLSPPLLACPRSGFYLFSR
jgi:hypothetical protein